MWVRTFIASVLSIYLTAFFMGVAQLENCVSHVLYYYGFWLFNWTNISYMPYFCTINFSTGLNCYRTKVLKCSCCKCFCKYLRYSLCKVQCIKTKSKVWSCHNLKCLLHILSASVCFWKRSFQFSVNHIARKARYTKYYGTHLKYNNIFIALAKVRQLS